MIDPRTAARLLGGEASGKTITCPGPGHSRDDRSLSVKLTDDGGFVVHSFAGDHFSECRDFVAAALGLGDEGKPATTRSPRRIRVDPLGEEERAKKLAAARWLWAKSTPALEASTVGHYLRQTRGIDMPPPPTLRMLASGNHPISMVAAFGLPALAAPGAYAPLAPGAVRGIHITGLQPDGSGRLEKKMLAASTGWPIALVPPGDDGVLAIAEGIETALSVHVATGFGVWAAGSAGRLPRLAPLVASLAFVVAVHVVPDADESGTGHRKAHELVSELRRTSNIDAHMIEVAQ